jgi:hypothetical protein
MKIYIKALKNVDNINSWNYTPTAVSYQGQTNSIYFQIVDKDRVDSTRYIPVSGASCSIFFPNLDNAKKLTIQATQPFPQDSSIWMVTIASNQNISSGNVVFNLTENAITRSFVIDSFISVNSSLVGLC